MIRLATESDAPACLRIYAPNVTHTAISFELEVPAVEEMARRIAAKSPRYPWLVLEEGADVLGYAYAGTYRDRPAYQWSVEVSVYVAAEARGRGVGRRLYTALLALLRRQGFVTAYAGIALPNEASVRLHESLGFTPIGFYRNAGFKLGRWHDVGWWQLQLQEPPREPAPPLLLSDVAVLL
jgi:L-amino acid N-acyltransferase YncA